MAMYDYRGRDAAGKLVRGAVDANSSEGVADQLISRGVTPLDIVLAAAPLKLSLPSFQPRVKLEDMIMLSRQLHSLTRSGVVLNRALRGLSQACKNTRLKAALVDVETGLNSGQSLAMALRRHREIFSELYINIVEVGENTGRLDLVFKQLAQYLELEKDTQRRVGAALRYPMLVLIAISAALVVLNIWVIPVFAKLFENFGADLPLATRVLIGTSNFFVNFWPLMVVTLFAGYFGLRHYLSTTAGRLRWDRAKLRLPAIGSILERSMLARFARSFALMLGAGVPLIRGLELTAGAVGNAFMAQQILAMRGAIQRGESVLRAASNSSMFTPLVLQMIQVGEETGNVDEMLVEVALFYEQEVDYDLKNLSSYIEPLLIAAMAALVFVLAMGIFLPMWDMFSVMQR